MCLVRHKYVCVYVLFRMYLINGRVFYRGLLTNSVFNNSAWTKTALLMAANVI